VILIPPGAKSVTAAAATDSAETSTDTATETETTETEATETEATPTETIPDAGDNCSQGTYTIVEGDYEGLVAGKFDVTVDALRAANVSTPGYSAFYPGLEIVIPAKSDC
jgi:LysM repeat protein